MSKWIAMAAAGAVAIGLGTAGVFVAFGPEKVCGAGSAIAGGSAAIGGPFTLVDHKGRTVTDTDVIDGPTLIYFGFTYCPDVCPIDTARLAEATDLLAEQGHDVTPVFITVDPDRDTPEAMADYVELLHEDMIGLTGTPEQVDVASKAYKTYYRKNGEGEDYLMDHSTFTYFVDQTGFREFFRRDASAAEVAETVGCYIDQG